MVAAACGLGAGHRRHPSRSSETQSCLCTPLNIANPLHYTRSQHTAPNSARARASQQGHQPRSPAVVALLHHLLHLLDRFVPPTHLRPTASERQLAAAAGRETLRRDEEGQHQGERQAPNRVREGCAVPCPSASPPPASPQSSPASPQRATPSATPPRAHSPPPQAPRPMTPSASRSHAPPHGPPHPAPAWQTGLCVSLGWHACFGCAYSAEILELASGGCRRLLGRSPSTRTDPESEDGSEARAAGRSEGGGCTALVLACALPHPPWPWPPPLPSSAPRGNSPAAAPPQPAPSQPSQRISSLP